MRDHRKGRILIVDDSEIVAVALQFELETIGHLAKIALNGHKAIENVKKEDFDIVYTDLIMPEMTGVELCKKLKKISPPTKVFLMSGYSEELGKQKKNFMKAGGEKMVITKPLRENEIAETTNRVLMKIDR